eukprot:508657-Amphidinium_carterae.1
MLVRVQASTQPGTTGESDDASSANEESLNEALLELEILRSSKVDLVNSLTSLILWHGAV